MPTREPLAATSFLYHVFGARTYDPLKTEYHDGAVYLHLIKKDRFRRCALCHTATAAPARDVLRCCFTRCRWGARSLSWRCTLHLTCHRCGALRQESRDEAQARKRYTCALAQIPSRTS